MRARTAVFLGVSVLLAGCATAPGTSHKRGVPDAQMLKEARLLAMADRRQADTLLIDELLGDRDSGLRSRAALAIGQVRIRERYSVLRQLLLDGDTAVAANAAYALGIAKDTAAIPALARAYAGAPAPVAREAAWSLGEIGEPARFAISNALTMRNTDLYAASQQSAASSVRLGIPLAAMVLATAKLRPPAIDLVVPWLADTSHVVVRAAAYVIGRTRSPQGARAILAVRFHADEEVRQHVARTLTKTVVGDTMSSEALAALRVLVRDSSERVRINAVRSLETFGPSVAEFVEPLFSDPAPNVRVAAAEGVADVFGHNLQQWQRAWDADTALAVRRILLGQIRRTEVAILPGVEAGWSTNRDWQYRVAAISSAARSDSSVALALIDDSDSRVARSARAKLGRRSEGSTSPRGREAADPVKRPLSEYVGVVRNYMFGEHPKRALIETDHGTVTVELLGRDAPLVVESFVRLARNGTYQNTWFHRVVPNFVAQDGDSSGDGSGEAGFRLRESWTRKRHLRGCLGLATAGPDTGGSQYYLCHSSQPHLDGAYTVFGQVVDGFEAMDRIVQGDRMIRIRIVE